MLPSACCVEFFISAVFVYMFACFAVSGPATFLWVALTVYVFAPRGLLSKLSMFFINAKPLMAFSLGHMHIYFIVSTNPETAREVLRITHGQSNTPQQQRSEFSQMKQPAVFETTDDQKHVSDSSSSKPQCRSNVTRRLESSRMKRPLVFSKSDDQNSVTKAKGCRVLKMDSGIMKPARKEGFANDMPACKDPVTGWTRRENTSSIESRKLSKYDDDDDARKNVKRLLTDDDFFQEMDKLEDAIRKLVGLIPDGT